MTNARMAEYLTLEGVDPVDAETREKLKVLDLAKHLQLEMNRRTLLRAAAVTIGAVTVIPLLAACGGDDDDDDEQPTTAPSGATATTAPGGSTPEAAATPTAGTSAKSTLGEYWSLCVTASAQPATVSSWRWRRGWGRKS